MQGKHHFYFYFFFIKCTSFTFSEHTAPFTINNGKHLDTFFLTVLVLAIMLHVTINHSWIAIYVHLYVWFLYRSG